MSRLLLAAALITPALIPAVSFACGGKTEVADKTEASAEQLAAQAAVDPTHCAKKTQLVGSNCSYATGMMAQRVLEEGDSWSYTGTLAGTTNQLDSNVAAPYTVGPDGAINVIANEIIELMVDSGDDTKRVSLTGKLLQVDGVTYFVATQFQSANT